MLTEMQVKNTKVKERDYKLADSEGLISTSPPRATAAGR